MSLSKTIKQNAKFALKGARGRAVLLMVITAGAVFAIGAIQQVVMGFATASAASVDYFHTPDFFLDDMPAISVAGSAVAALFFILQCLVLWPLAQGTARWYFRRVSGLNDSIGAAMYYFEGVGRFKKAFFLNLQIGLRVLGWEILLFFLPVVPLAAFFIYADAAASYGTRVIAVILIAGWTILSLIALALIQMRYLLAPYLLAADENMELPVSGYIKKSIRYMRGYKMSLFLFGLSFVVWYLLPVLLMFVGVFFLVLLDLGSLESFVLARGGFLALIVAAGLLVVALSFYLIPYMNASYALYARHIIELGDRKFGDSSTREYVQKAEMDSFMQSQQDGNAPQSPPQPGMSAAPDLAEDVPPPWDQPPES